MPVTGNNPSLAYILSIRLRTDGFSFYRYSPVQEPAIECETYLYHNGEKHSDTMARALGNSSLLKTDFVTVYCLVAGHATHVPIEFFRKEEATLLYRLATGSTEGKKIYYNILPQTEIAQVFGIDCEMEELLRKTFPDIRFYHIHSMVMEKLVMAEKKETRCLYACFYDREVFVFSSDKQQIKYANTFPAEQLQNAIYFILSVWKVCGMDAEKDECVLLGNSMTTAAAYAELSDYIRHIGRPSQGSLFRRPDMDRNTDIPFDLPALLFNII